MNKYTKNDITNCISTICNRFNLYENYNEIVKEIVYYLAHAFIQSKVGYHTVAMTNWSKANRIINQMEFNETRPISDKQYESLTQLSTEIREMLS